MLKILKRKGEIICLAKDKEKLRQDSEAARE